LWSDTDQKFAGTRIIFVDRSRLGVRSDRGPFCWHRFFSHQPDLNYDNPAVVDAIIAVMKFWLDLGVDAFRLDAVPYLCVREGTTAEPAGDARRAQRMRRSSMA
jgi:maltose alpha-D-glucosyltransferase/alpha-amylase